MLLAVGSVKGSPGATTAAVALAARWPAGEEPVLLECDPAGGDLQVRFGLEPYPGLVSLAAAARRSSGADLLRRHCQRLPGGLPVVAGAIGGEQAKAALAVLATSGGVDVLRRAADADRAVLVVDCGRLESGSVALPVARAADALVLLVRPNMEKLAHAAALLPTAAGWCRTLRLLLVGDGYRSGEVARELDVPVLGRLPADARGASALAGNPGSRHGPAHSALGRAAADVAAELRRQIPAAARRTDAGVAASAWSGAEPSLPTPGGPVTGGDVPAGGAP